MTKVLIFESDHAFAVELRTELSILGCTVQVFKEGASGLASANQSPPDLALISADLRPMNGFSICNKLKKDPSLQRVPVILMSAEQAGEAFEQHKKLRWRADDYVRKPISVAELVSRIRSLVPMSGSSGAQPEEIVFDDLDESIEELTLDPMREGAPASEPSDDDENEGMTRVHSGEPPASAGPQFLLPGLADDVEEGEEATRLGADALAAKGFSASPPSSSNPPIVVAPTDAASAVTSTPPPFSPPAAPLEPVAPISEAQASPAPRPRRRQASTLQMPEGEFVTSSKASSELSSTHVMASEERAALAEAESAPSSRDREGARALETMAPDSRDPGPNAGVVQLRQALVQAQAELHMLRPQLTDLSRARAELADLRRQLDGARDAAAAVAGQELTALHEQLHRRDEELLRLREELTARHRELFDARSQHTSIQRELVELRDRSLGLEQRAAEALARFEAVQADKALAARTIEDLKDVSRKMSDQLAESASELRSLRASQEEERARQVADHDDAVRAVEARLRAEISVAEHQHAAELDQLREALASADAKRELVTEAMRSAHREEVAELVASWERRLADAVSAPTAELAVVAARQTDSLAELEREHSETLERVRAEQAAELSRREARSAAELGSLQAQLRSKSAEADTTARRVDALTEELAVAERQRAQAEGRLLELEAEVRRSRDEADAALRHGDAFEAERGALKLAEREARHERDELAVKLASIESLHAAAMTGALEALRNELDARMKAALADAETARTAEERAWEARFESEHQRFEEQRHKLATELAALADERDEAAHSAQSRASRIAELEQSFASAEEQSSAVRVDLEAQLAAARQELATVQAGAERARQRSKEDRAALQKARDAISSLIAVDDQDS